MDLKWGEAVALYAAILSTVKFAFDWYKEHCNKSRLILSVEVRNHIVLTGTSQTPHVRIPEVSIQLLNLGKATLAVRRLSWKEGVNPPVAQQERLYLWPGTIVLQAGETKSIEVDNPSQLSKNILGIEAEDSTGRVWKVDSTQLKKIESDLERIRTASMSI